MTESRYPVTSRPGGTPGLVEALDDLMRRFTFPSIIERTLTMGAIAPVDVCERNSEFVIRMACPGCRPDDINVTVENDVVRIRGKFPSFDHAEHATQSSAPTGQHETCLIRELPTGRFERDITLPTMVNAQQVHATFENGLLTLTLPKAKAAQGQKIQITAGAGTATQ